MVWATRNSKKVVILVGHVERNMWWLDLLVGPIGEVKKEYCLEWHFMTNALGEC